MLEQSSNLLLASLTPNCRGVLMAQLRPVLLSARQVLYERDETPMYAHFMTSGIASVVGTMSTGASAETGIWGREGLVESFHLLGNARIPTRCFMPIEGGALRMPFKALQKQFHEIDELRECILQSVQGQGAIAGQLSACNRLHEAKERLARWFLTVRDRIEKDSFYLTHEFLAVIAGSRRTTVTQAARALHHKGLIRYSRGRIRIVDPEGLEKEACECYGTVRDIYQSFYRSTSVACFSEQAD